MSLKFPLSKSRPQKQPDSQKKKNSFFYRRNPFGKMLDFIIVGYEDARV